MANLVTTISESVVLNGAVRGSSNTVTTSGINNVMERILVCELGNVTTIGVFAVAAYTLPGAMDVDKVKYIRVTNLDDTNNITLAVTTATNNFELLIDAGNSYIMSVAVNALTGLAGAPSFGSLRTLTSLQVKPSVASCPVELFVGLE